MEKIFSSRRFHLFAVLLITVSTLLVYSNTFQASFQYDDLPQIVDNHQLKKTGNIPQILTSPRGITLATFALNYAVDGLNVAGYHIVNVSIHILVSIAVYFLIFNTLMLVKGVDAWSKKISVFSALIFALHPVQTQAVTYIVQRMESLSSLFYVMAILFFIKSAKAAGSGKRWLFYIAVGLSYLFGFYSKESAFTLPAVIFLYDFYFISKGRLKETFKRWPVYGILAALFIFFAVNTIMPLGGFGDLSKESAVSDVTAPGQMPEAAPLKSQPEHSAGFKVTYISPKEYLLTQFNVLLYYIALMAVPVNQNLDYDLPRAEALLEAPEVHKGAALTIPMLPPIVSLAIIAGIIGAALYLLKKTQTRAASSLRAVSFFILWYFIILSPTSSFIPIIDVIYEHRIYLASLGFFVIFVLFIDRLSTAVFSKKKSL
ncbi:MAG: hypothetical protein HY954_03805 [Deltaproteobacteria bacterium]|nr:hypothetical protein [Deltaproteobacteria bacterium]